MADDVQAATSAAAATAANQANDKAVRLGEFNGDTPLSMTGLLTYKCAKMQQRGRKNSHHKEQN
jgi:hypothetical protein